MITSVAVRIAEGGCKGGGPGGAGAPPGNQEGRLGFERGLGFEKGLEFENIDF